MASYQRVALFLLFDSIEQDLVRHVRTAVGGDIVLTDDERTKASRRILSRSDAHYDAESEIDLLQGLDIAEKYDVLMRHKNGLGEAERNYFTSLSQNFKSVVPVRNSVMHARPLTIEEYSRGFSFAQSLLKSRSYWPVLSENYLSFSKDPTSFTSRSIEFLDEPGAGEVLNNLPTPEYDDTGFLPRPELERELKKRILGRHPVITILGEGGNGKTALALQTLHGLVATNDHPFDAIIWISAKTSILTEDGVRKIGDELVSALSVIEEAASFEPGAEGPVERLRVLLERHKILLVIDNLETVQGDEIRALAEDIPGQSKLLITSRVPLGGDLSVAVGELSDNDAILYIRRLIDAYGVRSLRSRDDPGVLRYLKRLHNKPLLIKWFVLGVKSGANPDSIVANPEAALRFCLENVVGCLGKESQIALIALATISVPLSSQILEYVTDLNPRECEIALNELGRFGLVDLVASDASEQLYRLRPFAKSYAIRVMSPKLEVTSEIKTRYSRIESQYQSAKGISKYNPYSLKIFKIRSHSEMLAAAKLNRAVQYALFGNLDDAHKVVDGVRITDPGYFETYRTQAYIYYLQGDVASSCNCYESALELAPEEPQIHFFFACMLMRGVNNELAEVHFAKALDLDPKSPVVLREAARNSFVTHNFEQADEFLQRAGELEFKSYKDKLVYTDLRIQLYVRKIAHRIQAGDWESAADSVTNLAKYVYSIDISIFDEKMISHLIGVMPYLARLIEVDVFGVAFAKDLGEWINRKFSEYIYGSQNPEPDLSLQYRNAVGTLKMAGLQERYGFLKSDDGRETFVHASEAGQELWNRMVGGERIRYKIAKDANGKTRAIDLRPV